MTVNGNTINLFILTANVGECIDRFFSDCNPLIWCSNIFTLGWFRHIFTLRQQRLFAKWNNSICTFFKMIEIKNERNRFQIYIHVVCIRNIFIEFHLHNRFSVSNEVAFFQRKWQIEFSSIELEMRIRYFSIFDF